MMAAMSTQSDSQAILMSEARSTVPLQPGLIAKDESGCDRLVASQCPHCELVFFPQRKYCGKCGRAQQQQRLLSPQGTVVGFSVIDRKSMYSMIDPPYVQAEVAMPEGVHVFTVLDQCETDAVSVGMGAEVYVGEVGIDKNGNTVEAYKFRPARQELAEGGAHE